jgi:hypothetical protein
MTHVYNNSNFFIRLNVQRKNAEEGDGSQPPARLQRKLLKKVAFLESKFVLILLFLSLYSP